MVRERERGGEAGGGGSKQAAGGSKGTGGGGGIRAWQVWHGRYKAAGGRHRQAGRHGRHGGCAQAVAGRQVCWWYGGRWYGVQGRWRTCPACPPCPCPCNAPVPVQQVPSPCPCPVLLLSSPSHGKGAKQPTVHHATTIPQAK